MTTQPMILTLLPPGGFSNLVGHYVAALDIGSAYTAQAARDAAQAGRTEVTCAALRAIGSLEGRWIHEAVGRVPTPPAPEGHDVEAWLGWLDAVRTVSIMVLRPKPDRDLETLIRLHADGEDEPRTLKRVLAELLYLQGRAAGRI